MQVQSLSKKPMLLAGEWVNKEKLIDVNDPKDNSLIATVPAASREDAILAINAGMEGVKIAANLSTYDRIGILNKAANYVEKHHESFAKTIALEGSKTIREARKEVKRCINTLRVSAEEARRLNGETIPFDQMEGSEERVGYFYRIPIGLIVAITPFNDPLNLVAHKIGPAIASGNAIIVKPATVTPLSALMLAEAFVEAGLPPKVLQVITGRASDIGEELVTNPAVRMVSFTGGMEAGEEIAKKAGLKKLGMELGSNSPCIVMSDADVNEAVESLVSGSFWAAGQNCLGVQRIYIDKGIYREFMEKFVTRTKTYRVGDKLLETTDMGPMITEKEAMRVECWVNEAVEKGADLLCGGTRNDAFYDPTVLSNLPSNCTLATEEVFGPVVILYEFENFETAIEKANDAKYGLQAGIFTKNIDHAFFAIRHIEVGGIMVNDSSDYRIDSMPFGGVKQSGLGREGVKHSIQEMTEPKVVCFKTAR
jgi:glyceraldehyde-3-phosphate dehydrogenase (NADP+)